MATRTSKMERRVYATATPSVTSWIATESNREPTLHKGNQSRINVLKQFFFLDIGTP